jgi:hypothetical protein
MTKIKVDENLKVSYELYLRPYHRLGSKIIAAQIPICLKQAS